MAGAFLIQGLANRERVSCVSRTVPPIDAFSVGVFMMIRIETYLRMEDGSFTPLERCALRPPDIDYIEGAIEIEIGGVEIVGRSEWDYVDQLWSYIADMTARLGSESEVSTYYPDQPVSLIFHATANWVVVTSRIGSETRSAGIGRSELIRALGEAGGRFFGNLSQLAPERSSSYRRMQDFLARACEQ